MMEKLSPEDRWVEETLATMTLREKIGQMMVSGFTAHYMPEDGEEWQRIERDITQHHVGGFHLWRGDAYAAAYLTNKMQRLAKVPLLIDADFESGVGLQIPGAVELPTLMALGATGSEAYAYLAGKITALEARASGIHQTYAPVVDVNTNPDNPIVNIRSFGEAPELVARMSTAFIRGCQDNGLLATAKHFPGHGATASDSHIDLATVLASPQRLEELELSPFRAALSAGVGCIMIGHLAVPALEGHPYLPSSLSRAIVTDLLRNRMGYDGLVVTDAMGMGAVSKHFTPAYATAKAVEAGNDLILFSGDAASALQAVEDAVKKGRIPEEQITASVRRILRTKARLGLHHNRFVAPENLEKVLGREDWRAAAEEMAQRAITLVKNEGKVLPVRNPSQTVLLNVFNETAGTAVTTFQREVARRIPDLRVKNIDTETDSMALGEVAGIARHADIVLCAVYPRLRAWKGSIDLPKWQGEFIRRLSNPERSVVVIAFGNPYILPQFPEVNAYLCAYGWSDLLQGAAARAVFGESDITGKLPVSIPGLYAAGHGLEMKKLEKPFVAAPKVQGLQLKVGFPEEAGFSPEKLKDVEALVRQFIERKAFPGAVLVVAKDGVITLEKAFGHLRYADSSDSVRLDTIYDLASLTKVVATTTAVMILYDRGQIELEAPVWKYVPEFQGPGKGAVQIRHLLAHCSGLPAWKAFYKDCQGPEAVLRAVCETPLEYEPGTKTVYSDLGFILLGEIVQRASGRRLEEFCQQEIFGPLKMSSITFLPPRAQWSRIAPTENDPRRGGILQGIVHDENADAMGGVSGHAGLFGTARDLAVFMQMVLNGGIYGEQRIVREETVKLFARRANLVSGSSRALGWDTPSEECPCGHYFSASSFGHTGFTGTSLWADPERKLFVVLLTNRVHPTRENDLIRQARREVHDGVVKALQ